jgi:hypothetical protein
MCSKWNSYNTNYGHFTQGMHTTHNDTLSLNDLYEKLICLNRKLSKKGIKNTGLFHNIHFSSETFNTK